MKQLDDVDCHLQRNGQHSYVMDSWKHDALQELCWPAPVSAVGICVLGHCDTMASYAEYCSEKLCSFQAYLMKHFMASVVIASTGVAARILRPVRSALPTSQEPEFQANAKVKLVGMHATRSQDWPAVSGDTGTGRRVLVSLPCYDIALTQVLTKSSLFDVSVTLHDTRRPLSNLAEGRFSAPRAGVTSKSMRLHAAGVENGASDPQTSGTPAVSVC